MGILILVSLIAVGAMSDSSEYTYGDKWFTRDKFHHFSYSLGITGLSYHVYHCQLNNPAPGARWFSISLTGIAGIGKEVYDKYWNKSTISYKDLSADLAGIIIGTLLFTLY